MNWMQVWFDGLLILQNRRQVISSFEDELDTKLQVWFEGLILQISTILMWENIPILETCSGKNFWGHQTNDQPIMPWWPSIDD